MVVIVTVVEPMPSTAVFAICSPAFLVSSSHPMVSVPLQELTEVIIMAIEVIIVPTVMLITIIKVVAAKSLIIITKLELAAGFTTLAATVTPIRQELAPADPRSLPMRAPALARRTA